MKLLSVLLLVLVLVPLAAQLVSAHCPLCTAAAGTGVAVTRFYGVDDAITGVWLGGFAVSGALWFNRVFKKKLLPMQPLLVVLATLAITIASFYFAGIISSQGKIFGIDRLLFGMVSGTAALYLGVYASGKIRKKYGRVFFPFQSIAMILFTMSLLSAALWLAMR